MSILSQFTSGRRDDDERPRSDESAGFTVRIPGTESEPGAETETDVVAAPLFRLGRALFGGVLAFTAIDNLRNLDERIGYAETKNAPAPEFTVPATSGGLLFGGLGLALWRTPATAAAAIVGFLASITPVMHDFWNVENPEQQQQEAIHFLKNTALLGAAIAFLKFGQRND